MTEPILVKDLMTARVATVRPDHELSIVADAFERHPFHHLPVVAPGGKVLGIVSDRDLLRECLAGRWDPKRQVATIMTELVASIEPEAPLGEAALRLLRLGVNSLLVIEEGKLRGIVTSRDLLKRVAAG